MSKTPEQMAATMIANLKANTGKTLAQWLQVVKKTGLDKHGAIVKLLKTEHGMTHGYANLVAHEHLGSAATGKPAGDLVAAQYAGKKAALRPIYDALAAAARKLGKDVELSPKKAYVSLRRSKQFGLIQPSTATRVDVGLCLGDAAPTDRLEQAGSFNSMVTHRVRVTAPEQVDAELKKWLKQAFARA